MDYQRIDVPDSGHKLLEITLLYYHKAQYIEDVQCEYMDGTGHAVLDCCTMLTQCLMSRQETLG